MPSNTDTHKLIRGLFGSAPRSPEHLGAGDQPRHRPVVTVSRDHGSGGEAIAQALADHLGVHCFDKDLLDAIVREARVDRRLLERLDEHAGGLLDDWACSLLLGEHLGREDYHRYLIRVLLSITVGGGVVVGRGANLVLARRGAFRLRVCGSGEVCARRLAEQFGLNPAEACRQVLQVNQERAGFIRTHFRRNINNPTDYDLVVNTDHIEPGQTVEIVLPAMRRAGFCAPQRAPAGA